MTHFGWICGISRAPLMSLGGQPDASAARERFLAAPGEPPVACEAHVAVMLILYMRRAESKALLVRTSGTSSVSMSKKTRRR
jgi:hypothetical protein